MHEATHVLESVLETLLEEEEQLRALIVLALKEQEALVSADYPQITRISDEMIMTAHSLDGLERTREQLLASIDCEDLELDALVPMGEESGVDGFAEVRLMLIAAAAELRQAQEGNARLLLSAMRLQEKWMNMFSSLAATTYGAKGLQEPHRGRRFVSRSA